MKFNNIHRVSTLACAVGMVLSGVSVSAEIEEIVVTGLKKTSSLMETPSAITALTGDDLVARGITELSQLQFAVPSMHYGEKLGNKTIAIRGVGEFNNQPGVLVTIDGVVQSSGSSSQLSQLDLERVEVLRGPQGTLYGRNSNGGAVNYITAKPTDEVYGRVKVGLAKFDHASIEGVYSGPLTDSFGIRVAASHLDMGEGWVKNLMPGFNDHMMGEKTNFRMNLVGQVSENLDAHLSVGRSTMSGPQDPHGIVKEHMEYANSRTNLPIEGTLVTEEPWKVYNNGNADSDRQYNIQNLTLNWELDNGMTIKSITANQNWDDEFEGPADGSSVGLFQRYMKTWTDTFTQEINISGGDEKLNWIAGMFYMDDQKSRDFIINLPIPAFFPLPGRFEILQQQNDVESKSAFFDMTYSVSEDIRLGVGFRKTDEDMHERHSRQIFFTGMPDPVIDLCGGIVETKWSESANTGRASVEYDTSDDAMVYASYSEGFKVGGINESDCNPPWDPETVASYEVGYKATLHDGATTLSAAAFHYDYSDFQVAQVIGIVGVIANAGDATIDGFELEVTSNVGDDWTLSAGLTLLDSAYGEFLNTDALQGDAGVLQNKGNPLNKAPEQSLNVGIVRNMTFDSGARLALSLNTAYRSRTYFREFGQIDDSQAAYTVVNFNANFETADELFTTRFFVNNATNEAYITDLSTGDSQYGRHAAWGMPRHIGIELTRHFGTR